jgi:hypothetical protein
MLSNKAQFELFQQTCIIKKVAVEKSLFGSKI